MYWILKILNTLCVLIVIIDHRRTKYVNAEVFSDNTLIGHELFDFSTASRPAGSAIFLLADAGDFGLYGVTDGYLLGFQWTSDITDLNAVVNFQVYRQLDSSSSTGSYELVAEMGILNIVATRTVYYFPEAVTMTGGIYQSYFLAVQTYGDLPVHVQGCFGANEVLRAVNTSPGIGTTVQFDTVYRSCLDLSVQAIYLSTSFATQGCALSVIENGTEETLSYNLLTSNQHTACWVVRAAMESLALEISVDVFFVPCNHGLTFNALTAGFTAVQDSQTLCGSDYNVFDVWQSDTPYVHVKVALLGTVPRARFSFRIRNVERQEENTDHAEHPNAGLASWKIALIVLGCLGLAVCVCGGKKQGPKKQTAPPKRLQPAPTPPAPTPSAATGVIGAAGFTQPAQGATGATGTAHGMPLSDSTGESVPEQPNTGLENNEADNLSNQPEKTTAIVFMAGNEEISTRNAANRTNPTLPPIQLTPNEAPPSYESVMAAEGRAVYHYDTGTRVDYPCDLNAVHLEAPSNEPSIC